MKKLLFALALIASSMSLKAASEEARLLRFPTVGGDKIVFTYAGNLYSVGIDGGAAVKLSSHVGYESFPKISPDGKTIAFTGQYDGNTEVYTIPVTGGEPVRLTYSGLVSRDQVGERMGPNNIVMGWTPDGKQIIYRSKQHTFSGLRGSLKKVAVGGGVSETIPTSEGGFCSYSPDGKKLAMNRMFREFRTWKYYRGGQADEIWVNTVGTTKIEKITDNDAQDIFPMWVGNVIYYMSDRDRTMNLFAYDTKTKQTRKVTNFTEYDCKFPSHSQDWIVFENGGYIYKYDVKAGGEPEKVKITLADDNIYSRSEFRNISALSSYSLSPDGKRIFATVRGDLYSIPAEQGPVYSLSYSPESHEREATWSPDGKYYAWLSDKSGEYQVYLAPSDNFSAAKAVTSFDSGYLSNLYWNPDGKKLYFTTGRRDVWEYNVETSKLEKILQSQQGSYSALQFTSDGTWAAYTTSLANDYSAVFLLDVAKRKSYQVTDRWYNSSSPVISPDGKYLYFRSSRQFRSQYSAVEWNASYNVSDYLFVVTLAADTPNPMTAKSDEYSAAKTESSPAKGKGPKPEAKAQPAPVKVDIEGIGQRITPLPVAAGNNFPVYADETKLYFRSMSGGPMIGGPRGGGAAGLKVFDVTTGKVSDGPSYTPMDITADGKKVLVRDGGNYKVVDFGRPAANVAAIPVDEIDMIVDHEKEWKQIFDESWRITRDGFYVENMHGADWDAVYEKYSQLLPYVKHREDLSYIIGEMIGELNVGHAYITSGETPEIPRIATGLLGAEYSQDARTGAFRIEKIFRGASWDESLISPLAQPGVEAKVGQYITAINNIPASALSEPGQALVGKAGKTVAVTLADNAAGKNARTVYVKPVSDESNLAYYEWVQTNIEKVDKMSGGQIGYIHIPDMSTEGLDMFTKLYYAQLDKKALIIDDRMNGGGNVSPMILERLQREVYRVSMYRNGANKPVPNEAFYGPMVCLIDKYSSSDGDLFPYGFRKLGLGKLIGKRSWGGIVGISGSKRFVDGQDMRTPFFTSYSTEGEWIIEGHGVDPDIDIDINPFEDYLGKDAQLEKAVEVLKEELKSWKPLPGTPADPVKN